MSDLPTVEAESEAPEGQEVWVISNGRRPYRYFWNCFGSRRSFPHRELEADQ